MRLRGILTGPVGNAVGNLLRMACLFLLGRLVAQRLGGDGLLAMGQWQNLVGLGTALGGNALQAGFQQGMAEEVGRMPRLGCGLALGQFLSLLSCGALALAAATGAIRIPAGGSMFVLVLACAGGALHVNLQGTAAGIGRMGRLNAWVTISGLVPLALIASVARDIQSLSLALLCTPVLLGLGAWFALPHPRPSLPQRRSLPLWLPFLSIGVLPVLAGQVLQILLRQMAISHGAPQAALWQGAQRIVDTAFPVWSAAATAWILPRMARAPERPDWLRSLGTSLGGTLPLALLLALAAPWALRLALGQAFQDAAPILRWQCMTEIVRAIGLPMTLLLIAQGRARTFVLLETASLCLQFALAWLLIPSLGMVALPVAGLLENTLCAIALFAILRWARPEA